VISLVLMGERIEALKVFEMALEYNTGAPRLLEDNLACPGGKR
jgi:hypothetical protein